MKRPVYIRACVCVFRRNVLLKIDSYEVLFSFQVVFLVFFAYALI